MLIMSIAGVQADPGSFRDPAGRVFHSGKRVFRTIARTALDEFRRIRATPKVEELIRAGKLIDAVEVSVAEAGFDPDPEWALLEHPRLPFISYPYEWGFAALRDAALHHLDLQIELIDSDIVLSDATAYNVQFVGAKPIFMDFLSLRAYAPGETWAGHRQFRQQFLNPLLLRASAGVPHNAWYRGSPEGIPSDQLRRLLPFGAKFSWLVFSEVVLPGRMEALVASGRDKGRLASWAPKLPRGRYKSLLQQLRHSIAHLRPDGAKKSEWSDYASNNSYTDETQARKEELVRTFVRETSARTVWDVGCNTGNYSAVALSAGAQSVIGFDADQLAVDACHTRARAQGLNLTALVMDLTNQTGCQGWRQQERQGLEQRARADGVMALALIHHLAIGRNIPLDQIAQWLVSFAPAGVVEFVAKDDEMVQRLLSTREDIFPNYTAENFHTTLERYAVVEAVVPVSPTRTMFRFRRR